MRLVLFTGKGGVGKTTTAAATAVHASRCGLRTLVASADSAHSLADALGVKLGHEPVTVAPGLDAQQIDPRARGEQSWDRVQGYLISVLDQLGVDPVASAELTELPGVQEVLSLIEVRDQVRDGGWDLVVVDCAPSAETMRLLSVPEVLTRYLDRLLPMERRIARLVGITGQHRTRTGRGGLPMPADTVVEAAERLTGELRSIDALLRAPSTSVRLVMTPESVVLGETRRTWTALALHGFRVDEVIANRVFTGSVAVNDDWARAHHRVLAEAESSFAPVPLRRVAFAAREPVGVSALAELGEALHGPAAGGWSPAPEPGDVVPPFTVERDGDGCVLLLPLPLADRSDLDLGRRGDDLLVTVAGQRRVLALPSALRRCDVDGARFRDGVLAVRFRPDPALWPQRWGQP